MEPQNPVPVVLHWVAPTHVRSERTVDWYWALGIIAVFGTIASVLWGNLLFAGIIALGALSIIIMAVREPRHYEINITPEGVHVDHDLFPYHSLHSFWVADDLHLPKLFLATSGLIHPHISIPLTEDVDSHHVRSYLMQYLPEEAGHSFGLWFLEFLGF